MMAAIVMMMRWVNTRVGVITRVLGDTALVTGRRENTVRADIVILMTFIPVWKIILEVMNNSTGMRGSNKSSHLRKGHDDSYSSGRRNRNGLNRRRGTQHDSAGYTSPQYNDRARQRSSKFGGKQNKDFKVLTFNSGRF